MNRKVKVSSTVKKTAIAVAAAIVLGGAGLGIANAQAQPGQGQGGPNAAPIGLGGALVCSTTNYDDVAAQALNMQSPALRQALVSGKTLQQIATNQNVTVQTVDDALKTAFEADLSQALKDGLISQTQYDAITTRLNNAPSAANATPQATQNATPQATQSALPNGAPNGTPPRIGRPFGSFMPFINVSAYNQVRPFVVAATTINMSCADLVKAVASGQSIAQVATGKNVQAQTVIDALVSAEKAAITQDVQEGLLGQAQADGRLANITNEITAFVNNTDRRGRGGFGFGFGGGIPGNGNGGFPFPGGRGPRGGNGPQAPASNATQQPTPSGISS